MSKPSIAFSSLALAVGLAGCGESAPSMSSPAERGSTTARPEALSPVPRGVTAEHATREREIATEGDERRVGPWRIAYIVEPAEGWFEHRGDRLAWRPPARDETHHIEILPFEASTGRLVPGVAISAEVLDARGDVVDRRDIELYYAEFFHYASNFSVPRPGSYTLRATIRAPDLRRHGEEGKGPPLAEGATVEFAGVGLERE